MNELEINSEFYINYKDYVTHSLQERGYNDPDLVQDVFEAAMLHVDYFNHDFKGSVTNWINLLCVHVIDRVKRSTDLMNTDPYEIDYSDDSSEAFLVTESDLLISTNGYYYSKNKEEVDRYINMLPERQYNVVSLKLILGYTHDEISDKLNITKSASESSYSLGIKNLKQLLESDSPEEELLQDNKVLKPYGDKPYSGDWAWRPNESPDRSAGEVKHYSRNEVKAYCQEHNLNYAV